LPTDLVPQRDVGAQLSGDLFGGAVTYAAGVFNGCRMNQRRFDSFDSKDGAARIFIQPFKTTDINPLKGLGFGAGGSIGTNNSPAHHEPGSVQDDRQNTFFSFVKGTAPTVWNTAYRPGYYYWGRWGCSVNT